MTPFFSPQWWAPSTEPLAAKPKTSSGKRSSYGRNPLPNARKALLKVPRRANLTPSLRAPTEVVVPVCGSGRGIRARSSLSASRTTMETRPGSGTNCRAIACGSSPATRDGCPTCSGERPARECERCARDQRRWPDDVLAGSTTLRFSPTCNYHDSIFDRGRERHPGARPDQAPQPH